MTQTLTLDLMLVIIGLVAVLFSSILLTGLVRRYAMKYAVVDEPNERSSHIVPTPVGGGLAIAVCFFTGLILLTARGMVPVNIAIALGGGGVFIAVIGWVDDHRDIQAAWRAFIYLLAAIWGVSWIGGLHSLDLGVFAIALPYTGNVFAVLFITWLTNLYNFMDGTDGLAGIQASSAAFLSGVLFWLSAQYGTALICFTLMAASTGFLVWNWPPARIFMGDVGSCLLGYTFGVLAIIGEKTASVPVLIWIIMLAVFIGDASLTLVRRVMQKERWYSAHRSHAYQRYVQMGASHKKLALLVLFINITILWPLAFLAHAQKSLSMYLTLFAIIIVAVFWLTIQLRFTNLKSSGA